MTDFSSSPVLLGLLMWIDGLRFVWKTVTVIISICKGSRKYIVSPYNTDGFLWWDWSRCLMALHFTGILWKPYIHIYSPNSIFCPQTPSLLLLFSFDIFFKSGRRPRGVNRIYIEVVDTQVFYQILMEILNHIPILMTCTLQDGY